MNAFLSILAALLVPFSTPDKDELALQRVAFAPDAPAVMLEWETEQDDVHRYVGDYIRLKVLGETGRKYANIEIPYGEKYESIRDLRGRTIEPDGAIVPFDGTAFQKTVVKGRGISVTAKTFTLPDVRVGSIIEYSYTHTWLSDTYLLPVWHVQREIPILYQHHTFRGVGQPNYVTINLAPGTEPKKTADRVYEFEIRNMPRVEDEPLALPAALHEGVVAFFYQNRFHNAGEYWADAAGTMSAGFSYFIGDSRFIREAVPGIVAGAKTDEEKLRKIYARVQQVENLSDVHKSEKHREIRSAEDVLRNGYGNTAEIEMLFVALARAAGIDADPVFLANHKQPFSKELPKFAQLSSLAVVATIDGKDVYCDPGYSILPFGMLHYDNGGVDGMRLRKKGGPVWIRTPIPPASDAVMRRVASLHFDGDAVAGTLHVELDGYAAFRRRLEEQEGDDASRRKSLEDEVEGWLPSGGGARLTAMSSWKSTEPLTADFEITIPSVVSTGGSHTLVPLSLLQIGAKSPFTSETRRYDVHFDYAHIVEDAITLKLPAGVSVTKLPEASNIDEGPLSFRAAAHSDAASITFNRTFTIGTPRIPVAAYPRLRGFVASVAAADAVPAILEKTK